MNTYKLAVISACWTVAVTGVVIHLSGRVLALPVYLGPSVQAGVPTAQFPAATYQGVTFTWESRVTATLSGGGTNPITITAPDNGGSGVSIKQGLGFPITGASGSITFLLSSSTPEANFYNTGIATYSHVTHSLTAIANFNGTGLETDLWADWRGGNQSQFSKATYSFVGQNVVYCERVIWGNGNVSYGAAPSVTGSGVTTCPGSGFVNLTTQTNNAVGNPDSVYAFVDALDYAGANQSAALTIMGVEATTSTNMQASYP